MCWLAAERGADLAQQRGDAERATRWQKAAAAAVPHADGLSRRSAGQMLPAGMTVDARPCGRTPAQAHARSGDRIALAACPGGSATIANFAETRARVRAEAAVGHSAGGGATTCTSSSSSPRLAIRCISPWRAL